jgi:hypothetical protein
VNHFTSYSLCELRAIWISAYGLNRRCCAYPGATVTIRRRRRSTRLRDVRRPRNLADLHRAGACAPFAPRSPDPAAPTFTSPARHGVPLARRSPGALQPSQGRPSIARGFGKGSAGFRCHLSHMAGMSGGARGTEWPPGTSGIRLLATYLMLYEQLSGQSAQVNGRPKR